MKVQKTKILELHAELCKTSSNYRLIEACLWLEK